MSGTAQEVWAKIEIYPYEVSSLGRARHIVRKKIRKLKANKQRYKILGVSDGTGISKNLYMARLVCEAFNGPPNGKHVDHINRIRDDNRPENLRWVTHSENLKHRVFCFGSDHHNAKLNTEKVKLIKSLGFKAGQDQILAKRFNVSRETIRDVRLGKVWRHVNG